MRTGIDILGEIEEAKAFIKAAARLVESGMTIEEVSERLELTNEQIEQLEVRLALKKELA